MNLYELANNIQLTSTEQGILAIIHISSSPSTAYTNISGTQQLMVAQKKLSSYGLINVANNRAELTSSGRLELHRYNIVDEDGLTDTGKDILANSVTDKQEWISSR